MSTLVGYRRVELGLGNQKRKLVARREKDEARCHTSLSFFPVVSSTSLSICNMLLCRVTIAVDHLKWLSNFECLYFSLFSTFQKKPLKNSRNKIDIVFPGKIQDPPNLLVRESSKSCFVVLSRHPKKRCWGELVNSVIPKWLEDLLRKWF